MAKNNHARKAKTNPEKDIPLLSDEELDEMLIQDEEDENKEPSREVQQAIEEVRKELREKKYTLGVPDKVFEKPLSDSGIMPETMHAVSGNEEGHYEGMMDEMPVYGVTERGLKYTNDDGFMVDPESKTLIVTDGVGGYDGGFMASSVAHYSAAKNINKPLEKIPSAIHKNISDYQKANPDYENMSTTVVAARQISTDKAEFVHVGDSRALVIRNGKVVFETRDDNYLEFLMEKEGIESEDEARDEFGNNFSRYRNSITQACGLGNIDTKSFKLDDKTVKPHHQEYETQKGDVVLLCSDGLSDNLSNSETAEILNLHVKEGKPLKAAIEKIKKEALKTMRTWDGKPDNIVIAGYKVK
jgi:protein phosphatase